ncbi:MAG: hypothetical protein ABIG61_17710, partial [Planctomycetota bacterium]
LLCAPLAGGADAATRNNAVILYDWYLNVEGYLAANLDLNAFKSLEELCDTVPTGGALPRYRFDFNFDTDMSINDAKKLIWQSFNGRVIMSQGKLKPVWDGAQMADGAGSLTAKTVSHAFTEDNIVKDSFTWKQPERPNVVRIHFKDSDKQYKNSSVEIKDLTDIDNNGEILYEEKAYYITNQEIARRRAKYKFDKFKYSDFECSLTAFSGAGDLEVYDRVSVTHTLPGWTTKDFIVTAKGENHNGQVTLTLLAYYSGAYDDGQVGTQANYASTLINPSEAPTATGPVTITEVAGNANLITAQDVDEATVFEVDTGGNVGALTVKLSALSDGKIPYHIDDVTGLADGPTKTDVDSAVSLKHTQGTDTALGAVGTKNPPIDADKAIYRDSTASDALVTSTWTQIKAFLKTYFDTLFNLYVHPNHSGDVTSVADGAQTIANKQTMSATAPITVSNTPTVIAAAAPVIAIPAATNVAAGHATAAHIQAIEANTAKVSNATHTGEVTGATELTIANDAVTYAKMQNVSATDKLLGRSTAGAGDVEEIACTAFARSILDDANEATFKATVNLEPGVDVQAYDVDIALFRRHTLESGDDLTIGEDEQKLVYETFTINGTGSLTINGSGELCVI